jgi:hypothetical protein
MKKIIITTVMIVLMFVSFLIAGLFASNSGTFDEEGNFDLEKGLEILRELNKVPFIHIDVDEIEERSVGKLKAFDCLPQQRNIDGCIEIYQPVCGQMQVECITAPCDPVKQTFENSCKACTNERVLSYTKGECSDTKDIKK